MLLDQLVQEHHAGPANYTGPEQDHDGFSAAVSSGPVLNESGAVNGAAVNDNAEPASGVVLKSAQSDSTAAKQAPPDDALKSRAEVRTHAMHRFLSAQTDVSEEVLQLYKLVCTGFR
jgi:hypothetical protein